MTKPRSGPPPANQPPTDIHTKIENTIAILSAQTVGPGVSDRQLAVESLKAAAAALREMEAQLDLVTAPELDAAQEARKLRQQLEKAVARVGMLEQQLTESRDALRLEHETHHHESSRLKELGQKTDQMERLLETDDDAFGRFMDDALTKDEARGRLPDRD